MIKIIAVMITNVLLALSCKEEPLCEHDQERLLLCLRQRFLKWTSQIKMWYLNATSFQSQLKGAILFCYDLSVQKPATIGAQVTVEVATLTCGKAYNGLEARYAVLF